MQQTQFDSASVDGSILGQALPMPHIEPYSSTIRAIPAVVGRFHRDGGETASIAILPLRHDATILWGVNSKLEGTGYFTSVADAVRAAALVHVGLVREGWSER